MSDPAHLIADQRWQTLVDRAEKLLVKAGGGALCVYVDGRPVVDIWAGEMSPRNGQPWRQDTMAMAWSTSKGVASTVLHMLADRGHLDYDDLVTRYWPEFGTRGKEATTIRQVMAMEAGLFDMRSLISEPAEMLDHALMAGKLAQAAPAHVPGEQNGYHAFTYGWLVGELVQRITDTTLGQFVQHEIAAPLGLDGCYIGTPSSELSRVAQMPKMPPEPAAVRLLAKALDPITTLVGVSPRRIAQAFLPRRGNEVIGTREYLHAELPAGNGVFTARSLAKLYATLGSNDGIDGVQLWSPETRRTATTTQNHRRDRVLALKVRWQLGYHPPIPAKHLSPDSFGFYGAFGSGGFADPRRRLAVGFVVQEASGFPLSKLVKPIICALEA